MALKKKADKGKEEGLRCSNRKGTEEMGGVNRLLPTPSKSKLRSLDTLILHLNYCPLYIGHLQIKITS